MLPLNLESTVKCHKCLVGKWFFLRNFTQTYSSAQVCLKDWEGPAPGRRVRPQESGIVGNLLIQHTVSRCCSSDCVHEGCGSVDRWLQTKDQALLDFLFLGNPAGRPVQHAPFLVLKQLNFWMQFSPQLGRFMNWSNDLLDLDFSLTFRIISKWPYRGHEAASEDTMLKRGGGVCGSLWPWYEGGGRISCEDKEGEGAPGHVRGRGEIQVKCGDGSLLTYWLIRARPKLPRRIDLGAPKVALLIDLGVPKDGRFGDFSPPSLFFYQCTQFFPWLLIKEMEI